LRSTDDDKVDVARLHFAANGSHERSRPAADLQFDVVLCGLVDGERGDRVEERLARALRIVDFGHGCRGRGEPCFDDKPDEFRAAHSRELDAVLECPLPFDGSGDRDEDASWLEFHRSVLVR
jgi:hypothetical protein